MKRICKLMVLCFCSIVIISFADQPQKLQKANMNGYIGLKEENHHFVSSTMAELKNAIVKKEDGIYYMGYTVCPWCQDAVPLLEKAAEKTDTTIYYIAVKDDNHKKTFTEEENEYFIKWASDFLEAGEDNKKTLFVPYVFIMKNGSVTDYHLGTFDDHNANERALTKSESEDLISIYVKMMENL